MFFVRFLTHKSLMKTNIIILPSHTCSQRDFLVPIIFGIILPVVSYGCRDSLVAKEVVMPTTSGVNTNEVREITQDKTLQNSGQIFSKTK